jgi:hypothetical protein
MLHYERRMAQRLSSYIYIYIYIYIYGQWCIFIRIMCSAVVAGPGHQNIHANTPFSAPLDMATPAPAHVSISIPPAPTTNQNATPSGMATPAPSHFSISIPPPKMLLTNIEWDSSEDESTTVKTAQHRRSSSSSGWSS